MNFILAYSLKRFWRKRAQILTTAFFLCLGFWGWLLSESTQTSIKNRLENNARNILAADLTIDVRREFTKQELSDFRKEIEGKGKISQSYEFFAMLTTDQESRLVQVRVIDDFYPFYGTVKLENGSTITQLKQPQIWAYAELKNLMDLKLNESIQLGEAKFKVGDFISEDQTQTFRLASLAPTIFIHLTNLKATKLIQFGSTFSSIELVKLNPAIDVVELSKKLKSVLKDPGIDVTTYKSLPDDLSGPTQRLSDFLGLTSLVSLLFCSLSLFYLLQIWSSEQQKEKAALAVFGLSASHIQLIEFFQSIMIAALSTALSTILVKLSTPIVESSIQDWFAADFSFKVTYREVSIILICQIILLAVLTFPFKRSDSPLSRLIKDEMISNQKGIQFFLPLLFLIWPFAIFASRSLKNGSYFFGAILGVCLSLILLGWGFLKLLKGIPWKNWQLSYATKALSRQTTASWAFIVTVGLCSALLNLMPQIRNSVQAMISFDQEKSFPSLFMFDIQQEQYHDVLEFLQTQDVEPQATSPLIRARISKINNKPFERQEKTGPFVTREEDQEANLKNRSVNLTYRDKLQKGDKIIEGDSFPLKYDANQPMPYISIEKNYASKLNLKIGDVMTFEVQGIEVSGKIKNIREVRWSRFEPNFFILFQDGILNDAPQTHLASLPALPSKKKADLMKSVSKRFANVSLIDVERLIRDLIKNLNRVSGALKLMTSLSFLTGLLALVFLLSSESIRRSPEVHLLKVLGSQIKEIQKTRISEIFLLSTISLIIGLGSSYFISFFIVDKIFQVSYTPEFATAGLVSFVVLFLSLLIVKILTSSTYRKNSFVFLKKEE
jgi:putative ABC transport system permease protein